MSLTKADFEYDINNDVITIEDLDLGNMSVTNDIENVITEIVQLEGIISLDGFLIMYMDSSKKIDGIKTKDNKFVGWIPLQVDDFKTAEDLMRLKNKSTC